MLGVTGPNEYENNVNNNWYTNLLAAWCLRYAAGLVSDSMMCQSPSATIGSALPKACACPSKRARQSACSKMGSWTRI